MTTRGVHKLGVTMVTSQMLVLLRHKNEGLVDLIDRAQHGHRDRVLARATIILSPAKRAALTACLNGGILHKRCGGWTAPSASACDKPISGVTVADLGRDGMLTLSMLHGSASARLTTRGNWFARTAVTEMAERAAP
jgi:hypothetical protein